MPIVDVTCPHCGAPLKVNPEAKRLICQYCGNEFIVEEAIKSFNVEINNSKITNIFNGATIYTNKKQETTELTIVLESPRGTTCELYVDDVLVFSNTKACTKQIQIPKGMHILHCCTFDGIFRSPMVSEQIDIQKPLSIKLRNHILKNIEMTIYP